MAEIGCDRVDRKAAERVAEELAKPDATHEHEVGADEFFGPWSLLPSLYGCYSSLFDDLAIDVLRDIFAGTYKRGDLASEMFREMLCSANLCDYGTSPRVCFPTPEFNALLPSLIERWEAYRKVQWEESDND